ncbi:hypothetical protein NPIL_346951 [Nephila pilipes]|uniref:Uncharacterized protein n=1 Tax=Nephila pilipes TaxID=299642 RepID=A0A8X6PU98_NEPPI|nr:hypothetical protein NPIL_346951 [Nephila pilipes]
MSQSPWSSLYKWQPAFDSGSVFPEGRFFVSLGCFEILCTSFSAGLESNLESLSARMSPAASTQCVSGGQVGLNHSGKESVVTIYTHHGNSGYALILAALYHAVHNLASRGFQQDKLEQPGLVISRNVPCLYIRFIRRYIGALNY